MDKTEDSVSKGETLEARQNQDQSSDALKTGGACGRDEDEDTSKDPDKLKASSSDHATKDPTEKNLATSDSDRNTQAKLKASSSDHATKDPTEKNLATSDSDRNTQAKPKTEEAASPEPAKDGSSKQPSAVKQAGTLSKHLETCT